MGKDYFISQLSDHHMQEVVIAHIPQHCAIKQQFSPSDHFSLNKASLYNSVYTEGERGIHRPPPLLLLVLSPQQSFTSFFFFFFFDVARYQDGREMFHQRRSHTWYQDPCTLTSNVPTRQSSGFLWEDLRLGSSKQILL